MNFIGVWITRCGVRVEVIRQTGIIWEGSLSNDFIDIFWDLNGNNINPNFDLIERVRDAKLA